MCYSYMSNSIPNSSDQASLHENITIQRMMTYFSTLGEYWGGLKFQIDMRCETGTRNPPHSKSGTTYVTTLQNSPDLSILYSFKNSDVTIYCENKEYFGHRQLLCNKSSVFRLMFSHPMVENKTGKVNIEDAEPQIVKEFLRYIYTGSVKDMEKHALKMILIADKYDVQDLRLLSELEIISGMSNENVFECYNIGKLVNSIRIVNKCLEQIQENKHIIWKTEGEILEAFKKFPRLMFEAFMY